MQLQMLAGVWLISGQRSLVEGIAMAVLRESGGDSLTLVGGAETLLEPKLQSISISVTFPWFYPTLAHRRKDTPSCIPLLEWFRCIGPKDKALYKLENLLSPLLFYYCLNWFIHCNRLIMDNIAYVTLDAGLDCSWNVLLSLGPLQRDVFEMNWVADVWIFCRS